MAIIYKTTDEKRLKVGDVTFVIRPLSFSEKREAEAKMSSGVAKDIMDATILMLRYTIKSVEGIQYSDGSSFELKKRNGKVTEDAIKDLLGMEYWDTMTKVILIKLKSFNNDTEHFDVEGKLIKKIKAPRSKKK